MHPVMAQIALSGVIGALSYALDIAEGQPPGHAIRSCLIGMRLAAEIDLSASDRSDLFYALLLKDAGCSANANRMAVLFAADDRAAKATSKLVDWTNPRAAFLWSLRTVAPEPGCAAGSRYSREFATRARSPASSWRPAAIAAPRSPGCCSCPRRPPPRSAASTSTGTGAACPTGYAARRSRWRRASSAWRRRSRCSTPPAASRPRDDGAPPSGTWFDPALVDAFLRFCDDRDFWAALEAPDVSAWEPPDFALAGDDARLDRIAEAFARVIDAKSPFTASHSQRVAEIADGIAAVLGFTAEERRTLRRAALLHDIGKLAISSRILDKPDKLTDEEFRAIQTHPVHTLRILERAPCFAALADLAANHHEKLDGSGYPRSLDARHLDLPMRVLAVADVYEALTADRPYRGPLPVEEALAIINRDVPHKLDADALGALEVHVGRSDVSAGPAGLTLSEA